MPRKVLIKSSNHYYHVTTRSNHRHWFALPLDRVWEIACNALHIAQTKTDSQIAQFVLMSNHYHLLIKTPRANLDCFMYFFNKKFSDQLRKESKHINRMFGGRYNHCLITNNSYLINVYRYIYQNPLRAKIVKLCQDYPYSTLWHEYNQKTCPFLQLPLFAMNNNQLEILNSLNDCLFYENCRVGLRKKEFKLSPRTKISKEFK